MYDKSTNTLTYSVMTENASLQLRNEFGPVS